MYVLAPVGGADTGHARTSASTCGKGGCAGSFPIVGRVCLSPPAELRFSDSLDASLLHLNPGRPVKPGYFVDSGFPSMSSPLEQQRNHGATPWKGPCRVAMTLSGATARPASNQPRSTNHVNNNDHRRRADQDGQSTPRPCRRT
jgi:hypothetical protein